MEKSQDQREILLVDDDPDYTEITRTRLEASGYQVLCASNGREAIELLQGKSRPSLIILDIEMPDQNGLTALINLNVKGKIRREGEENAGTAIPVVVATGLQSGQIRELIMRHQISAYLQKPYSSEELLRTVKQLIGEPTAKL